MSDAVETQGLGAGLGRIDRPLFAVTGGFIVLFCALALFDIDLLGGMVDGGFAFAAR